MPVLLLLGRWIILLPLRLLLPLVLFFEDGRGRHLLLLLERHGGVGGLRVGHVVLHDHLVIDGVVGRRLGGRRAPASAAAAALWALGAAGGFGDSWVLGFGFRGVGERKGGRKREESTSVSEPVTKLKLVPTTSHYM